MCTGSPYRGLAEKKFEEIMAEKFSNLMKTINLQIQETQQTPNTRNMKKTTPRHIIIISPKASDKEKILKAARQF